jgi:hypothetical protein
MKSNDGDDAIVFSVCEDSPVFPFCGKILQFLLLLFFFMNWLSYIFICRAF